MPNNESRERGRPRARRYNLVEFKALEYLGLVSMKYEIDSNVFFNSLIEASENQESKCENLAIKCCKKTKDSVIFLVTKGSKVVGQFSIPKKILTQTNPIKNFVPQKILLKKISDRDRIGNPQIKDLKVGMKRIFLTAKIIEIQKPRTIFSKFGQQNMVANAKIKDETGIIQLPLWNQQIGTIALGDNIRVENACVVSYRGEHQLRVNKGGQLSVIEKSAHIK
ncbi:MAG: hypothetical protein JW702_11675 [Clostridiales bacterium]|nr:hypothetical protein [Clostridiales bacterium]